MTTSEDFAIWPPYRAFYEESLRSRITSALNSVEIVNSIIQTLPNKENLPADWRRILLDEMQNIVIQAGAISKFFWPPRDGEKSLHKKRGEYLQKIFKVQQNSPLKSRTVRDHIEHFDEKLDRYLQIPIAGHIFPELVASFEQSDGIPQHIFRGYYLDSCIFQILNEKIEINSLVEEIVRINDLMA
ncbi:MAG: hypothetical protein A2X86_00495 [Bdellovibrionales bacterium GWA2_49_15]|nr:MAG: hypothetical protein A2X86_00495 [Bdellovibrionales bacterium GWA2_49_15]HAZ13255.1 hypothetical protein [Bdellovibrionales bacterium]